MALYGQHLFLKLMVNKTHTRTVLTRDTLSNAHISQIFAKILIYKISYLKDRDTQTQW